MAKILFVRTRGFSIIPRMMPEGYLRMGYVEVAETDIVRDALIGAAPLILGNLVGVLEVLHARDFLWRQSAEGTWSSAFWTWLDLKLVNLPPAEPLQGLPTRFLWWWRSSRVLQDFDLQGNPIEIIDEFPFFSYLLADLHPHVLAMPFAFLAMGLALNVFSGGFGDGSAQWGDPARRAIFANRAARVLQVDHFHEGSAPDSTRWKAGHKLDP